MYDARGALQVRPLYYGLRVVSLLTAAQGRLLPVTVAGPHRVHAFATVGDDAAVRVLVINLTDTRDVAVTLRGPGTRARAGTLVRLHAPTLDATTGLSLGGLTWDGSTDGNPVGGFGVTEPVERDGDGWTTRLDAYDAVVVTLPYM